MDIGQWMESTNEQKLILIDKLRDHEAIKAIILEEHNWKLRKSLASKIQCNETLYNIILLDPVAHVKEEAARHLTDQSILEKVVLSIKNPTIRKIACKSLEDQDILGHVSLYDPVAEVRMQAIYGLTDDDILYEVAMNEKYPELRLIAVQRMQVQFYLMKIGIVESDKSIRNIIIDKICDEYYLAVLIDPYFEDKESVLTILEKFEGQNQLERLAQEHPSTEVRTQVIPRLVNSTIIRELALNDRESAIRGMAVQHVSDTDTLLELFSTDHCLENRRLALEQTSEPAIVNYLALEERNEDLRLEAIDRCKEQEILAKIVDSDEPFEIRRYTLLNMSRRYVQRMALVADIKIREIIRQMSSGEL